MSPKAWQRIQRIGVARYVVGVYAVMTALPVGICLAIRMTVVTAPQLLPFSTVSMFAVALGFGALFGGTNHWHCYVNRRYYDDERKCGPGPE